MAATKEYVMQKSQGEEQKNQGEGDREAARRFNQSEQDFVKQGKVDRAAQAAQPNSPQEERELEQAEQEGLSRSKGEDHDPAEPVGKPPRQ
jgi:hypothetical protein